MADMSLMERSGQSGEGTAEGEPCERLPEPDYHGEEQHAALTHDRAPVAQSARTDDHRGGAIKDSNVDIRPSSKPSPDVTDIRTHHDHYNHPT